MGETAYSFSSDLIFKFDEQFGLADGEALAGLDEQVGRLGWPVFDEFELVVVPYEHGVSFFQGGVGADDYVVIVGGAYTYPLLDYLEDAAILGAIHYHDDMRVCGRGHQATSTGARPMIIESSMPVTLMTSPRA